MSSIRRIIQSMAKFRNMHRFVEIVREHNIKDQADELMSAFVEDMPFLAWMKRDEAIDVYSEEKKITRDRASEVYEDVVKFDYIHPHDPHIPNQDKYLKVTTQGRHLLEAGGMWRAWADDNKNLATIVLAVVTGVIIGGASVIVGIIAL